MTETRITVYERGLYCLSGCHTWNRHLECLPETALS